jgi:hypothetical protein
MLSAPMHAVHGTKIPLGSDVFGAFPRVLAAVGSSVGAIVILAGAVWSAVHFARGGRGNGSGRRVGANALIALGTLVLSAGGILQGTVGRDTAFTVTLTLGIAVIYGGFLLADARPTTA